MLNAFIALFPADAIGILFTGLMLPSFPVNLRFRFPFRLEFNLLDIKEALLSMIRGLFSPLEVLPILLEEG
jgi:hypothetical protein